MKLWLNLEGLKIRLKFGPIRREVRFLYQYNQSLFFDLNNEHNLRTQHWTPLSPSTLEKVRFKFFSFIDNNEAFD